METPRTETQERLPTFGEVLCLFETLRVVSIGLGVSYDTTQSWKRRDYIPANYHAALADLADMKGVDGLTVDLLGQIAAATLSQRLAANRSRKAEKARANLPRTPRKKNAPSFQRPAARA